MVQPNGQYKRNQSAIYRPKALQHYLEAGEQMILPPLVRPRTFLFLWLLLGLFLAGGSVAWLTHIPIRAAGFAVVTQAEGGSPRLICFMSAEAHSQVNAGQQVLVRAGPRGEYVAAEVQAVREEIISPYEVQTRFDLSEAAASLVTQPTTVVTASLPVISSPLAADALLGAVYNIEVTTGSRPLISLVPVIGPAFAGES